MGFFGEIREFLQLSCESLFGTRKAYLHLEKPRKQEVFLSKTNPILTEKQCARCSSF
jgi:hypothetical protein